MNNVSVLICCKNSENFIENCLLSISAQNPLEIVVIDGESKDETVTIANKYTGLVFSDENRGLGYARKLGVSKCSGDYVVIVSPDDIISSDFLEKAVHEISRDNNIAALLAPKKMQLVGSFWDYGQDAIYKLTQKFPIRVVGNPSIYRGELLKKFSYDDTFSANEDTDLCERWSREGYKVGWGKEFFTIEVEQRSFQEFRTRYIWYGKGDFRFYRKWKTIDKKVSNRHLLHPFKNYMVKYSFYFLLNFNFKAVAFTILCGYYRYYGFYLERQVLNNKN
jgi:glycosyltransferase involved in cell wall biosynthesis